VLIRSLSPTYDQISFETVAVAQLDVKFSSRVVGETFSRDYNTLAKNDIDVQLFEAFRDDIMEARMESVHQSLMRVNKSDMLVFGLWPALDITDEF